jgi:hypothetical protein
MATSTIYPVPAIDPEHITLNELRAILTPQGEPITLAKLEEAKDWVNDLIDCLSRQSQVECVSDINGRGCGHRQPIGHSILYQFRWYDESYDRWRDGPVEYRCHACDKVVRLDDTREVAAFKRYFMEIQTTDGNYPK